MCHIKKTSFPLLLMSLILTLTSFSALANHDNYHYYQIKIGSGVFDTQDGWVGTPIVSFGKRFELGDSALEISGGYGKHNHANGDRFTYFSLPKITYVQFYNPTVSSGFFYGGGLSFSQVKNTTNYYSQNSDNKFTGAFAEGTVGYEFKRNSSICPIFYIDVSQALVAESKVGHHPGPSIMIGMSAGF